MRKPFIAALFVAAAANVALAQEAPAPAKAELRSPKIAVLDMAKVSSGTVIGKGYAAQLEVMSKEIDTQGNKMQTDLQKLEASIKALQEELEKQANVLSEDAAERKRQEITRKGRERDNFIQDGRAELQSLQGKAQQRAQQLNNEFQARIKPVIEAVAKEKGVDILLDSQVALTVNQAFDISQDVIVRSDEIEKKARAAAPAAPKPAAAAAKPAAPAPSPKP